MKIQQGYKQTELGVIPEDWKTAKLDSLGFTYAGLSGKNKEDFGCGSAKYIPFMNILNNLQININDLEYVNILPNETQNAVQRGDLFFNTSSETPEEIGMCSVLTNTIDNTYLTSFCFGYRLFNNNKVDGIFLSYYFRSAAGRILMSVLAQGATRYNLAKNTFLESTITLPPIKEQQKIAKALCDIDALIAALDKKIAKKRLIKQGAMIRLLSLGGQGKKWFNQRIKNIVSIKKGEMLTSGQCIAGGVPVIAGGKSAAGYHNVANRPANTITISASGASAGYVAFHDFPIFATDCSTIEPNESYDIKYIYYLLSFYQPELYALQTGGAQPHVHPNDIYDLKIYYETDKETQQKIAAILSDMDREITDLETRRDKYKLIKSGMMQKLLTGQIRLIKPQAKVISLAPQISAIREIPVDTHIIAGHIVNRCYQSRGWGRTKLQKSLHLIGYNMQLNLGNEYIRNTAGPDDQRLMNYIDQKFKQYRHVNIVKEKLQDGRTHYTYTPTALIQDVEIAYEQYPQDVREQIDALLDKLNTVDLAGAEVLSTLYAVWNNRIIKDEQITDDLLISDFYAWSEHKAKFEETRVRKALDYMRVNHIIPIGWGKYIDKK